jgi:hypothetical protein
MAPKILKNRLWGKVLVRPCPEGSGGVPVFSIPTSKLEDLIFGLRALVKPAGVIPDTRPTRGLSISSGSTHELPNQIGKSKALSAVSRSKASLSRFGCKAHSNYFTRTDC